MDARRIDRGQNADFSSADATKHLRDHLECALRLARGRDLRVIQYLIQMAIRALSYPALERSPED